MICKEHHIQLQSWYPLGHGNSEMLKEPVFVELAKNIINQLYKSF